MKLVTKTILVALVLSISACGKVPYYQVPGDKLTAKLKVVSPQGYIVTARTFENAENCQQMLLMKASENFSDSDKLYTVEANKKMALDFSAAENPQFGYSCHWSADMDLEPNNIYQVSIFADITKGVCHSSITNLSDESQQPDAQLILDGLLSGGWALDSPSCPGFKRTPIDFSRQSFETGLFTYSWTQTLLYDYSPRRVVPK